MAPRRTFLATGGAVIGAAVGGLLAIVVAGWLTPQPEVTSAWVVAPEGVAGSVLLVGAGVGLFLGCGLALRLGGAPYPWLTAVLVLAVLPFAAPLVQLAGRLGALVAALAGLVLAGGAITGVRWFLVRDVGSTPPDPSAVRSRPSGRRAPFARRGRGRPAAAGRGPGPRPARR